MIRRAIQLMETLILHRPTPKISGFKWFSRESDEMKAPITANCSLWEKTFRNGELWRSIEIYNELFHFFNFNWPLDFLLRLKLILSLYFITSNCVFFFSIIFFLKGGGSKYIALTQLCLMFYEHEKMFWFRMFYFVFQGAKKTRGSLKNTKNKKKMLIYCQDQKKLKPFFEKQGMRYYPSIRLVVTVTLGKLLYLNLLWWPM